MYNIRVADPITINGRVYFNIDDAANAVNAAGGIVDDGSCNLIIGLLSVDALTQQPQVIVANNAPIVKLPNGKYQYTLDSTVWATWFATYQAVQQLSPEAASELCRVALWVLRDCPSDSLPQIGENIMDTWADYTPYYIEPNLYYNQPVYLTCSKVIAGGSTSYPNIFYSGVDNLSQVGVNANLFNCGFGGYMDEFLSKNTAVKNWYINFYSPTETPGVTIANEVIMPNPFFVQPS